MTPLPGTHPLRIGTLGAATITPFSLIGPARQVEGVEVTAVAARSEARAMVFAKKHGIARVLPSYEALVTDPDVDAVYVPLPNRHHAEWTTRALRAGKHVLCEKPFTANAAEAHAVAAVAAASGKVCMEAFHWRHHPFADRVVEILASGELGAVTRVETFMCIPLPVPGDIRYRLDLAGGATMDVGAYAIHMLRTFGGEPAAVTSAKAQLASPGVDRSMTATFAMQSGATGVATCSLWSWKLLKIEARITCERGSLFAWNPIAPQFVTHKLVVRGPNGDRTERFGRDATYTLQLRRFADVIAGRAPLLTGPEESVRNMEWIDAVYRAAGLAPRGDYG
jgi:predicted dehydrogenase